MQRVLSVSSLVLAGFVAATLIGGSGCRRKHHVPEESSAGNAGEPIVAAEPAPPVATPAAAAPAVANNELYYPPPPPPSTPVIVATPDMAAPALGYSRTSMPDGGTVNGDPKGPRAADMNRILNAAMPKLEACVNASTEIAFGTSLRVDIKYVVGNDGKPTKVEIAGPVSGKVQECLRGEVEALGYPAFEGPPVSHGFPFSYERKLQPPVPSP